MGPQQQLAAESAQSELSDSGVLQATCALKFIQRQLVELATDCGNTVQNGLVSLHYFVELQNKLEKLLHDTRSACSPPLRKPLESDFETIKRVSGGSFGSVNLVRHKLSDQTLAMKVIKWQVLTEKSQIQQVLVERDILTFIDSPFVVSMFCSLQTQKDLRVVMEYVAGGDCASLLDEWARFPVDMARMYVAETTMALEYIHSYGILHRDLKPSNLLISSTGHIKMTDFGLSKIGPVQMAEDLKKEPVERIVREFTDKERAGTPIYMAPETILRQGYGKPVDWWAVGIILYEFLVGEPPFDGNTIPELYRHVTEDDVSWPERENAPPADAQDLITLLLRKDCVERLGTGGASEVKAHTFFQDLDWNNLLRLKPKFVPELKTEEDTSYFDCRSELCLPDECSDDESPVELPDFSSVAYRFRKIYGSPKHLSIPTPLYRSPTSRLSKEEKEEQHRHDEVKFEYDYIYDQKEQFVDRCDEEGEFEEEQEFNYDGVKFEYDYIYDQKEQFLDRCDEEGEFEEEQEFNYKEVKFEYDYIYDQKEQFVDRCDEEGEFEEEQEFNYDGVKFEYDYIYDQEEQFVDRCDEEGEFEEEQEFNYDGVKFEYDYIYDQEEQFVDRCDEEGEFEEEQELNYKEVKFEYDYIYDQKEQFVDRCDEEGEFEEEQELNYNEVKFEYDYIYDREEQCVDRCDEEGEFEEEQELNYNEVKFEYDYIYDREEQCVDRCDEEGEFEDGFDEVEEFELEQEFSYGEEEFEDRYDEEEGRGRRRKKGRRGKGRGKKRRWCKRKRSRRMERKRRKKRSCRRRRRRRGGKPRARRKG